MVCRALSDRITQKAYEMMFMKMFQEVSNRHSTFDVGVSLQGIVADWSDTQRNALGTVLGEKVASAVCKGCKAKCIILCVCTCTLLTI